MQTCVQLCTVVTAFSTHVLTWEKKVAGILRHFYYSAMKVCRDISLAAIDGMQGASASKVERSRGDMASLCV